MLCVYAFAIVVSAKFWLLTGKDRDYDFESAWPHLCGPHGDENSFSKAFLEMWLWLVERH